MLSTSLLVDRVLQHTGLIKSLATHGDVSVWASSYDETASAPSWKNVDAQIGSFPHVRPFRERPHNYLRRLNEFVWDYRLMLPSRVSMQKHVRDKRLPGQIRALKLPAKLLAYGGTEQILENALERLLVAYPRSAEAADRLAANKPDVVVSTGPFQFEQPAIFTAAKRHAIPTLAYIPSWDNVSTKNRMVFKYDGYIVWNEQNKEELLDVYPHARQVPVYVVGAPQFDVFFLDRFKVDRATFCSQQGLQAEQKIIVYSLGSPNFLKEHHGAIEMAKRVKAGHFGNVQLLVRPHPIHDNAEMRGIFAEFGPNVRLQSTPNAGRDLIRRTQDESQIVDWVNTFRHADVVVNLASTVTIDAAICDTPVVNLDFDPQPNRSDQTLIKDVNHRWNHFKPIAESGGVWLVNNFDELENAVKVYLENPEMHKAERKWIAEYVCGRLDGHCGERMATAIADFVKNRGSKLEK
ncbi:MAG: hypothetical protein DYH05_10770 [Acidobacteria bacterium ACB1]|nr:hypothetical protein [Acidobacteria bacterium ACB1]RIJ90036.1 MAG: hypothetical protein DCC44_11275 [Acidobacteriota bacterium]